MPLTFDPEFAAALAAMSAPQPSGKHDVATLRAEQEPMIEAADKAQPTPADVSRSEHRATSADGTEVKLRWFVKDGAAPGPAAVYLHGGGYILGHIGLFDGLMSRYASATGVSMLLVEYRRAPEHPYPAALDDAYAALRWLHDEAEGLGVDRDRIAVMGDSAGAGLTACVSILARDRGGPKVARQIMVMPMLDDRNRTPDPQIEDLAAWKAEDNVTAWGALLGDAAGGPDVPATAAPARLEDASGLPPAFIEVGQIDIFRDEDLAYATKLSRAGVPVELHLRPGVPHEFDAAAPETDVARRAIADRVRVLESI